MKTLRFNHYLNVHRSPPGFGKVSRMFYCIGAQKAGTTWLFSQLRRHAEVHVPAVKEVHYWDSVFPPHLPHYRQKADRWVADLEALPVHLRLRHTLGGGLRAARLYQRMFSVPDSTHRGYQDFMTSGWAGQPVIADVSPGYAMMGQSGFAAMDAASPDARFVMIMRDPVDRLWSNIRHNRSRGTLSPRVSHELNAVFERALRKPDSGPVRRSDYARTMHELEAAVPADRIAYFFFETLFTSSEMKRLSDFLGIGEIEARFATRVNSGDDAADQPDPALMDEARKTLAHVYRSARERFGDAVPASWCN